MASSDPARLRHTDALNRGSSPHRLEWPAPAILIHRCFLALLFSALLVLFAIVFYNTLFGTQGPASTGYSYPYPVLHRY